MGVLEKAVKEEGYAEENGGGEDEEGCEEGESHVDGGFLS